MEKHYYEQSVSSDRAAGGMLYGLCWFAVGSFLLLAMFFGANVFVTDQNVFAIRWGNVLLLALCLAACTFVFLRKDYLRIEYDYILRDGVLEIHGILNRRRRKMLAEIALEQLVSCGVYNASIQYGDSVKEHKWFLNGDKEIYFMQYRIENVQHMALLELDDHIAAALRSGRLLRPGTWKNTEGKTMNYAGLS